jgi:hypothetical protein
VVKITDTLLEDQYTCLVISRSVLLGMRNFQTKFAEKIKTHILCSIKFILENRAFYEIMWKEAVERGRPQMTVLRMRIACRIPKATDIHSEYMLIAFMLQECCSLSASVLRRTYTDSCLTFMLLNIRVCNDIFKG